MNTRYVLWLAPLLVLLLVGCSELSTVSELLEPTPEVPDSTPEAQLTVQFEVVLVDPTPTPLAVRGIDVPPILFVSNDERKTNRRHYGQMTRPDKDMTGTPNPSSSIREPPAHSCGVRVSSRSTPDRACHKDSRTTARRREVGQDRRSARERPAKPRRQRRSGHSSLWPSSARVRPNGYVLWICRSQSRW